MPLVILSESAAFLSFGYNMAGEVIQRHGHQHKTITSLAYLMASHLLRNAFRRARYELKCGYEEKRETQHFR